jgi:hypothetical protein
MIRTTAAINRRMAANPTQNSQDYFELSFVITSDQLIETKPSLLFVEMPRIYGKF